MGRPSLMPQGDELIAILEQHHNLSYPAIHKLHQWEGSPNSVKGAAARAGYRRNKPRTNSGGGPVDVASHDEFWEQVAQTAETFDEDLRQRAYAGRQSFHGTLTNHKPSRRLHRYKNWTALGS